MGLMEHNQPCPLSSEVKHHTRAEIPLTHRRGSSFENFCFHPKLLGSVLKDPAELLTVYSLTSSHSNQLHFGRDLFFF